ncbi:DUF6171 family protein [Konateibacter massiliensis]|uniref:DUF6171 family protein n=1 Tax=Konateibacter massiliensis TaxID=2002841 RepID=UPI0015D4FA7F|nr:DUF6171 family protein [Konateibacter massiliensis]
MNGSDEKRLCKKCLLLEFPEGEYFKHLYEYIDSLDADIKADETEYDRRLTICVECPDYFQGMCRVCGCFVELRAVIAENECASPKHLW